MKKYALAAVAALVVAQPASAITINLFNTGGVEQGTAAYNGFRTAANFWESVLRNNSSVNLNVGFSALGPGILGSTGSTTNVAYTGDVLRALDRSRTTNLDRQMLLPNARDSNFVGGVAVDAIISGPKANGTGVQLPLTRVLDNDASANNSALSANTSLMKALGLAPTYAANNPNQIDGSVSFSSSFAFDFNATDGITAGSFDFLAVAIHEIGHALGFRSGVDVYDGNTGFAGNLNGFAIMSIWDLFRYSEESAQAGVLDWAIGGNPYFSLDRGQTVYDANSYFSTGRTYGDGQQASHWLDTPPSPEILGLLDPTLGRGQMGAIEALDLAAYDAMGWDLRTDVLKNRDLYYSTGYIQSVGGNLAVPEPATWAMMIGGFGLVGGALRRRRSVRTTVTFG